MKLAGALLFAGLSQQAEFDKKRPCTKYELTGRGPVQQKETERTGRKWNGTVYGQYEGNGNETGRVAPLNGCSTERKRVLFYDAYCSCFRNEVYNRLKGN